METRKSIICSRCSTACQESDPFCGQCGELLPSMVFPGDWSVELLQVPSEQHRDEVARVLKSWFPSIDPLAARRLLQQNRSVLVTGIRADCARRIVLALKAMKVVAMPRLPLTWRDKLINGGLAVSALCMLIAPWVNVIPSVILLVAAVAAPFVEAVRKHKRMRPLVAVPPFDPEWEKWLKLSAEYGEVMSRLDPDEAVTLKAVASGVFDLRGRLAQDSLASVAAGETRGELYDRLFETLVTAVDIGRRMSSESGEKRDALKEDLNVLQDLMDKTRDWFRTLGTEKIKETGRLAEELRTVRASVDAIVQDVRPLQTGPAKEKILS